jgi:hypothetical protein
MNKRALKQLSLEINKVLEVNEKANEMAAGFDGGEFSQMAPDFSDLVKLWKLTPDKLLGFIETSSSYAHTFNHRFPMDPNKWQWDENKGYNKSVVPHELNPWHWVTLNLDLVYMTTTLYHQPDAIFFK